MYLKITKKIVNMEFSVLVKMCWNKQFKITDNLANTQIKHFEKQCVDEIMQFYHILQYTQWMWLCHWGDWNRVYHTVLVIEGEMEKRLVQDILLNKWNSWIYFHNMEKC